MKANLRDSLRDPEATLPDWTRMVPGSTATPTWYFRKRDESEGREWSKRDEPLDGKSGLSGTWQRDVDGPIGSSWMRLPDQSASVLEEAMRKGQEKITLVLASPVSPRPRSILAFTLGFCFRLIWLARYVHCPLHKRSSVACGCWVDL